MTSKVNSIQFKIDKLPPYHPTNRTPLRLSLAVQSNAHVRETALVLTINLIDR